MSKEQMIDEERWAIAKIMADNFHINGEGWDESDFEWTAHCLQMAGFHKQSEPISCGHEKGGGWISVDERLPEVDKNVLVITAHGSFKVARCNIYKNGTVVMWATNDGLGERAITHWMPLPEPPMMKGGAG